MELDMKTMKSWFLAAGVLLGAAGAMAQQGAGAGAGPGAGMGAGMGAGPGGGARWDSDNTPGWSMMTEQERKEHQDRMRAMKTYEECKAYADQHREQMGTRAKERGGQALAQARRDPCAGLKR
jgi:hypothetical protein